MGGVFTKTVTRPLPPGAEIIERQGVRLARWRDARVDEDRPPDGQGRAERIRYGSATCFAKSCDGNGYIAEEPTECREEAAAHQVLADVERKPERVRAGLISPAEARTAEHLARSIAEFFEAWLNTLAAAGSAELYRHNVRTSLNRLADRCGFNGRQTGRNNGGTKAEPPTSIGPARLAEKPAFSGEFAGSQGVAASDSPICRQDLNLQPLAPECRGVAWALHRLCVGIPWQPFPRIGLS
jgi:hypothetical protein